MHYSCNNFFAKRNSKSSSATAERLHYRVDQFRKAPVSYLMQKIVSFCHNTHIFDRQTDEFHSTNHSNHVMYGNITTKVTTNQTFTQFGKWSEIC